MTENKKFISFIGLERCDMAYYLSSIVRKMKKKVLVIDNSISGDLFHFYEREDCSMVSMDNWVIARLTRFEEDYYDQFDVVVMYHGLNVDEESLLRSDYIYVLCSYLPKDIRDVREIINPYMEQISAVIFRDKISKKVSENYVMQELGFVKNGPMTKYYVVPLDIRDYEMHFLYIYNGVQKFAKNISEELSAVLTEISIDCFELTEKEIKKYVKK